MTNLLNIYENFKLLLAPFAIIGLVFTIAACSGKGGDDNKDDVSGKDAIYLESIDVYNRDFDIKVEIDNEASALERVYFDKSDGVSNSRSQTRTSTRSRIERNLKISSGCFDDDDLIKAEYYTNCIDGDHLVVLISNGRDSQYAFVIYDIDIDESYDFDDLKDDGDFKHIRRNGNPFKNVLDDDLLKALEI